MFYQIMIFIFLINCSIEQNLTKTIKPYFCDSDLKIDEIKNIGQHFKRLIRNKDQIYFVFKNRIIFTKLPELFKSFRRSRKYFLETYDFFEQINEEIDLPDEIPSDYQIYGHNYEMDTKKTTELYFKEKFINCTENKTDLCINGSTETIVHHELFELNFKETDVLAKRSKLKEVPIYLRSNYYKSHLTSNYIDSIHGDKFHFLTQSVHSSNSPKKLFFLILNYTKLSSLSIYNMTYFSDTNFFLTDYTNNYKDHSIDSTSIFFFGIDQVTFKLNLAFFKIPYEFSSNHNRTFNLNFLKFKIEYDFDELFSCHTPYSKKRQIKGIYYENELFIIFIKRFYLKIEHDLVLNGFYFEDQLFSTNAFDLKFENEKIYKKIKFENLNRKWVKTIQNKVYLVPSDQDRFELSTNKNKLIIKQVNELNYDIINCLKQTLEIENEHLFCFNESIYFYESSSKFFPIQNIFKNSSIEWLSNQKLKFIFNYKEEKVIFMTLTDIFVFEYSNFKVNSNQELIYESDENVTQIKNKLFRNFITNAPTTKSKTDQIKFRKYIIMFLTFVLMLLFLFLYYLILKHKQIKVLKYLENRKEIDEFIKRSKKKYEIMSYESKSRETRSSLNSQSQLAISSSLISATSDQTRSISKTLNRSPSLLSQPIRSEEEFKKLFAGNKVDSNDSLSIKSPLFNQTNRLASRSLKKADDFLSLKKTIFSVVKKSALLVPKNKSPLTSISKKSTHFTPKIKSSSTKEKNISIPKGELSSIKKTSVKRPNLSMKNLFKKQSDVNRSLKSNSVSSLVLMTKSSLASKSQTKSTTSLKTSNSILVPNEFSFFIKKLPK